MQGVRGLKFSLLALHSQENTALLEGRGASKAREHWQQPSKVLLPTAANWFCTGQDLIPVGGVKKGLGSQDISLQTQQCRCWEELIPSTSPLLSVFNSLFTWLWGAPTHAPFPPKPASRSYFIHRYLCKIQLLSLQIIHFTEYIYCFQISSVPTQHTDTSGCSCAEKGTLCLQTHHQVP